MVDDSNFYYIEKVGDEERHFDNAHETELTKVNVRDALKVNG